MSPQVSRVSPLLIRSRPRSIKDRETFIPNNILSTLTGVGFVMLGWTGFNGGDPFVTSTDASMAILNTHICTATSLLTWLILDIVFFNKPSVLGTTPGHYHWFGLYYHWCRSGSRLGCNHNGVTFRQHSMVHNDDPPKEMFLTQESRRHIGSAPHSRHRGNVGWDPYWILAEPKLNRIFYLVENWQHYIGFAYGIQSGRFGAGLKQLVIQILGLVFVICLLIKVVVPLRLDEEALHMGDDSVHGEREPIHCMEMGKRGRISRKIHFMGLHE